MPARVTLRTSPVFTLEAQTHPRLVPITRSGGNTMATPTHQRSEHEMWHVSGTRCHAMSCHVVIAGPRESFTPVSLIESRWILCGFWDRCGRTVQNSAQMFASLSPGRVSARGMPSPRYSRSAIDKIFSSRHQRYPSSRTFIHFSFARRSCLFRARVCPNRSSSFHWAASAK